MTYFSELLKNKIRHEAKLALLLPEMFLSKNKAIFRFAIDFFLSGIDLISGYKSLGYHYNILYDHERQFFIGLLTAISSLLLPYGQNFISWCLFSIDIKAVVLFWEINQKINYIYCKRGMAILNKTPNVFSHFYSNFLVNSSFCIINC